jgi:hypothetical protein
METITFYEDFLYFFSDFHICFDFIKQQTSPCKWL